jgi:3-oxoacyl-[acyl-carrier-protein] synthase II
MSRRVVITGIGLVSPFGNNTESFFNNLLAKKTCISGIPESYYKNYKFKSKFYVKSTEINFVDNNFSPYLNNITNDATKYALLGTKKALIDSGFTLNDINKKINIDDFDRKCLILIGTGFSNLEKSFKSFESHIGISDKAFHRMCVPFMMPNAVSSWISILFNLHCTNFTLNASCASSTIAIGESYEKIKYQDYDIAITGGVECLKDFSGATMRAFDTLDVLTKSNDGIPRPFTDKRSGFLYNEGAGCILILEELTSALKRKANIYAEITGYTANSDGYNIIQIDKSGEYIKKLFSKIDLENIDYINLHGTGTLQNDQVERNVIKDVFGEKENQPISNSTKGIIGHTIGASGAIETAVCALSIQNKKIHGNFVEEDIPDLNLNKEMINKKIDNALSLSFGFGGHNAILKFSKLD